MEGFLPLGEDIALVAASRASKVPNYFGLGKRNSLGHNG